MNTPLENLFTYDHNNSCVYVLKNGVRHRQLLPDEDNMVNVFVDGNKIRMKFSHLVWSLVYKRKLQADEIIFHKDLDENNNSAHNLVVVTKKEKAQIKEALKNLTGSLRLLPHPTDLYAYILEYRIDGRLRRETIEDIVPAKKKLAAMQVKMIKFLGKYVVSN